MSNPGESRARGFAVWGSLRMNAKPARRARMWPRPGSRYNVRFSCRMGFTNQEVWFWHRTR